MNLAVYISKKCFNCAKFRTGKVVRMASNVGKTVSFDIVIKKFAVCNECEK